MSVTSRLKKIRQIAAGLVFASLAYAVPAQAVPVLFYSDLDSAPAGAYVTVWGKDFGIAQGSLTVGSATVGASDIVTWSDTMVEFRLPAGSGDGITLTDSVGDDSNVLSFTTRSNGTIYFVSKADGSNSNDGLAETDQGGGVGPWRDLSPVDNRVGAGDVVYVRTGIYDEVLDSGYSTNFRITRADGTQGNPVAFVAYPGEIAIIGGSGGSQVSRAVYINSDMSDITVAKFIMQARSSAVETARSNLDRIRIVGNEVTDTTSSVPAIGVRACSDCKVLGNHVYNSGQSGSKLSHMIYYGGWAVASGLEIAWNNVHDARGGRCIQVYGHLDNDHLSGLSIHDNVTYNCPYDCILVGGSDGSNPAWVSDATIYNNVAYSCNNAAIRVATPDINARVLHNTTYDSSNGLRVQNTANAEIRNNIFANVNSFLNTEASTTLVVSNNGYDGSPPNVDSQPLQGDPMFTDPAAGDFSLDPDSPFKGVGATLSPPLPEVSVPASSNPDLGALGWVHHATTPESVSIPRKPVPPTVVIE